MSEKKELTMKWTMQMEGEGCRLRYYPLTELEAEGIDLEAFNPDDPEDLRRMMENLESLAQSGELDLVEKESQRVENLDSEGLMEWVVENEEGESLTLAPSSVTLDNRPLRPCRELVESLAEGDLLYLRDEKGRGIWEFSRESDEKLEAEKIGIGYLDCSETMDVYDALRESYTEALCDTILPETVRYEESPWELERHDFVPISVEGTLYRIVVEEDGTQTLQRIEGGEFLWNADLPEEEL
jgi:hypothetical protein